MVGIFATETLFAIIVIRSNKGVSKLVTEKQIDSIVDIIVKKAKPDKIILFGSYAYGQPTNDSDVDILIINEDSDVSKYKRGREIRKYLRGIGIPLDILVYTQEELNEWKDIKGSFLHEIVEKGKTLYG
jgi:predicted nucleotidyltransferase